MRAVLIFTATYTIGLYVYGISTDSSLTNLYTWINVGLFVLFALLHIWARWPIHALWAVSLVGLGNMLGGVLLIDGMPLYTVEFIGPIRYDKFFHAAASAALAVVAWEAMKRWAGEGYHRGGLLLFTWLVVMGGGAVVEIAELIGSAASDVNVGTYENNILDLVANGLGALMGIGFILWWERRRGSPPLEQPP
jgi:hypothetical protein